MDSVKLGCEELNSLNINVSSVSKSIEISNEDIKMQQLIQESNLSEEELMKVYKYSESIDLSDTTQVMQYGMASQNKMAEFSDKILRDVTSKSSDEVGPMLSKLVLELKSLEEDEKKGLLSFFKKKDKKLETLKIKFSTAEANVSAISRALENHQIILMKDINILDKMYELNLTCFKELSMYILAGRKKLEKAKNVELNAIQNEANSTGLPEDIQKAKDYREMIDRFEKKIMDLEISRMISLQTGPQIRMVQNSNSIMVEKIQAIILNTIPLWKNQMVIALGSEHSMQAAKAQQAVADMTNELLMKNASSLKTASITTAKEANRGIVDIETLKATNDMLISTIDEVVKIQNEGIEKRTLVQNELRNMENKFKENLSKG